MPHDHFPRDFGMHRVGIVQQRWTKKRKACIEQQPETCKGEDDFPRTLRHIYYDSGLQKGMMAGDLRRSSLCDRSHLLLWRYSKCRVSWIASDGT